VEIGDQELCYEVEFPRFGNGLAPIVNAEFAVDILEVGLDGVDGDAQLMRNLLIGLALDEQV
jgi:hypothetical protein